MRVLFFVLITFLTIPAIGQSIDYQWAWAKHGGGEGSEQIKAMETDWFGNTYVVGSFSSDFVEFGYEKLVKSTNNNTFILKYDTDGDLKWTTGIYGLEDVRIRDMATDAEGNIYIAGEFWGKYITIGKKEIQNEGYWRNKSSSDMLLIKLNPKGDVLWAVGQGRDKSDYAKRVVVDAEQNVFLVYQGQYRKKKANKGLSIDLNLGGGSSFEQWLVKYNADGKEEWHRPVCDFEEPQITDIHTDWDGNLYVMGNFSVNELEFGDISLIRHDKAQQDMYLVKYDPKGEVIWAMNTKVEFPIMAQYLRIDPDNNILIAGQFGRNFNSYTEIGGVQLESVEGENLFLTKLTSEGKGLWAKSFGSIDLSDDSDEGSYKQSDQILDLHFDDDGSAYVFMKCFTEARFDKIELFEAGLHIAKYNLDGKAEWALDIEEANLTRPIKEIDIQKLVLLSDGNFVVSGHFQREYVYLNGTKLWNRWPRSKEIFLAKIKKSEK